MGDTLVLFLLIVCIVLLILNRWISFSFVKEWFWNDDEESSPIEGEIPTLLRENGYEPVEEKIKIPISIEMDEKEYSSRLYVDYLAKNEEGYYVVILSREKKPLRRTGAAIRDYSLVFDLLYQPQGILYVDQYLKKIEEIQFEYPDMVPEDEKKRVPWGYLLSFVTGVILTLFITQ